MKSSYPFAAAVVLLAASILFVGLDARSQKHDDERVAQISHLMEGISKSNMSRLSAVVRRDAPATDKEWRAVEVSGALLNEIGHIIVEGDRAVDDVWIESAAEMRAGTAALVKATQAKDWDGVKAAFANVGKSCKSCHKVHKE